MSSEFKDHPLYDFVVKNVDENLEYHYDKSREDKIKIAFQRVIDYMTCELEQCGVHEIPRDIAIPNLAREYKDGFEFLTHEQSVRLAEMIFDSICFEDVDSTTFEE